MTEFVKVLIDWQRGIWADTEATALGVGGETLWAIPLGGDLYRLDNYPLTATGIQWGDVVRCELIDGWLTVVALA